MSCLTIHGRTIHNHHITIRNYTKQLSKLSDLYNALSHHGLGHLHEACNVGTLHVVDLSVGLCAVLHAVFVNVLHYELQTVVYLF